MVEVMLHLHEDCLIQIQKLCTLQRYSFFRNNDKRNSRKNILAPNAMLSYYS